MESTVPTQHSVGIRACHACISAVCVNLQGYWTGLAHVHAYELVSLFMTLQKWCERLVSKLQPW
jgi:hypothetical protein